MPDPQAKGIVDVSSLCKGPNETATRIWQMYDQGLGD